MSRGTRGTARFDRVRSRNVIMAVGLSVTALTAATVCVATAYGRQAFLVEFPGAARWLPIPIVYGAFSLAFVAALRGGHRAPLKRRIGLLVAQVAIALTDIELLYVVAAGVPFVLSRRGAIAWIVGQELVTVPLFLVMVWWYDLLHLDPIPRGATYALAAAIEVCWQSYAFAVGWVAARAQEDRDELVRVNDELRRAQELLAERTRLAERLAISRELHDVLGHRLAALSVNLDLAERLSAGTRVAPVVSDARSAARTVLGEVRDVVGQLRTPVGLEQALRTLRASAPSLDVRLDYRLQTEPPPTTAHTLYRCAQEAVTNAVKHANASMVCITVEPMTDDGQHGIGMAIQDDGEGCGAIEVGHGLTGIQERVAQHGGAVQVDGAGGFSIDVWIPDAEEAL